MTVYKIFKHKARYNPSKRIDWMVETSNGYWGTYPTLKRAKNEVRWAGGKSVRSFELDFSK